MKRIAVIMAHPDDEVLGCGATLARYAREGAEISILILATGLTSRGTASEAEIESLQEQAKTAGCILGASLVEFAGFPDNAMDSVSLLEVIKCVEGFAKKTNPDVIFTHHNGDINIDHDVTQRAVLTAFRPLPGSKEREIFACNVLSSSEYGRSDWRPRPDCYVALQEEDVDAAVAALECYSGEIRQWPHPRSSATIRYQARLFGAECGRDYAQVFEVLRLTR